ncbi:hypothetical protein PRUPE_5G222700 [Prunus persica]|uniref:Uncharacterized protein n=1 Tax=Prunus persica TaxID=3760 RepID=A0A251PC96_PRUPE|nr:uncharacterized protein LOC18777492 isoform X3 [Prunus persica]ONI09189.1 hypothetical protein PRUPE_5G222700 [Prunus persica]
MDLIDWRPNWQLRRCCNRDQVTFLISVAVCTVVILVLWRTVLMTPFKLITVFLHEVSHALACMLTCGKVEGIKVHADEGGVTQTRGGIYWLILPAGYLGSSFWGMVLILASTKHLATQVAAGCFIVALFVVLFLAKNWTLRGLCIGFIILFAGIWYLQETTPVRILREIILFTGVMNSLFSVYELILVMPRDLQKSVHAALVVDGVSFGRSYLSSFSVDPCTLLLWFWLEQALQIGPT